MQIRSSKNKQRKKGPSKMAKNIIIIGAAVLLAGAAYFLAANAVGMWPFSQSPEGVQSQSPDDSDSPDEEQPDVPTGEDKKPVQYEGENPNQNTDSLSGIINHQSINSTTVVIRVTIDQYLDTGTCTLSLTSVSSGTVVTRQAAIIPNPSSSTCEGFDVPLNELGQGTWNISILVRSGDKSGEITGSIAI